MSDSLVPHGQNLPSASREDSLTRQFYQWETRGRGWLLCNYPVELEPPFRPVMFLDDTVENLQDDASVPTFLGRLFDKSSKAAAHSNELQRSNQFYRQRMAELDEPVMCDYHD